MWPEIVDYFQANPIIFAVVCGALAIILITIIALCVKGAKAKKATQALPAPVQTPCADEEAKRDELSESQALADETPMQEEVSATEDEACPPALEQPITTIEEAPAVVETQEPAPETEQKKTTEKKSTKSAQTAKKIESFKKAMKDTVAPFHEEDEMEKVAKYSGKWVICRVINADDTDKHQSEELYFFELHASNGERLLSSEEYTSYNGALGGIETHKANIAKDNFRITLSKKGDYIFKLMSGKNMLLCMGEHYATKARCESAIESTKRFAKTAVIDESIQDIVVTPIQDDDNEILPPAEGYNGKWIVSSYIDEDGEETFYFELFASNGEKLLSSEEYTTYIGAINGIGTHKANIQKSNFRITLTKQGDYIYKLLSGNGQLLCLGEHYKTKRRCLNAVESVKRFALNAPVLTNPKNTEQE